MVIHDLSEIRKIENELRKSQDGFKSYFEYGPVGMCVNSPDNVWKEINQEFCHLLGYEKEELFAMEWKDITHPDDILANQVLAQKVMDGEIDHFKMEKRYIRKDGQLLHATLSLVTSRNADGSINYLIASFIDNTEHYQAVETLKHERQILRTLVDHLPFPIYFIDENGRKLIANKADFEYLGFNEEQELLGKTDEELYPNEIGKRGHADNMSVIYTRTPIYNKEESFTDSRGVQRWLQTSKIPLIDSANRVTGLVGFGLDVTQHHNLQDKIAESETYYRTLVNVSPDGIAVVNPLGQISFVSNKMYNIFGIPQTANLIGESIFNYIAPEDVEFAMSSFQNVVNNDIKAPSQIFRCKRYDGSIFWGESTSSKLEYLNDQLKGIMVIIRDITLRKQAEEEILIAKRKAEESDQLKSAFLQNISHEIRTPMNGILGFMEILEDPAFSRNEKKQYANIVKKSGQRLMNTINDIVEISKIMTSQIETSSSKVNINDFIQEHYTIFRPLVEEKGLIFNLNMKTNQSIILETDEAKLDIILSKILDNAMKFTTEGAIELGLKIQKEHVLIFVKDTGVGIDPKKLSAIFQPFYQSAHDFSRKHEGAGLGLSISKAYVEMLGGKIWIESNPEEGSVVSFSIPV